jgi:hypothetical protein
VKHRQRGREADKRVWAFEQNEARETYLNNYYGMDVVDHMIKTVNNYITWKYWHSAYLHAQSMVVVAVYDMYKECCEGLLDSTWKINEKEMMLYSEFCMKLSKQCWSTTLGIVSTMETTNYACSHKITRLEGQSKMLWILVSS